MVFECVRKVLKCDPWSPNEYECVEFEISDLWSGKIIARYNAVTDYIVFYDLDAYELIQRFNTEKAIIPLLKNCRNVSPLAEP